MPAMSIRIAVAAAFTLVLIPALPSQARTSQARPVGVVRGAAARAPSAATAELVPRINLPSRVVQVTSRYGVGFTSGHCNEPAQDFCSVAARLYHSLVPGSARQERIGTVAGTAAGGASGRLGFIMNIPGWQLLRARRRLTVTVRGTIVHGDALVGRMDQRIDLNLVP